MSRAILYSCDVSPPCRAVLLLAKALGIDLEIRDVNLFTKEQLHEDFVKINPQHTLPTLIENGYILWESHAIMCYLADKYGKDDTLYPKDLKKRATVDQRLYFEAGVLFPLTRSMARWIFYDNHRAIPEDKMNLLTEAFEFMDKFLEGKKWLAGDTYTLADISCVTSVSTLNVFLSISKYPNMDRWFKACETTLPGYAEANAPGNKRLTDAFIAKMQ